MFDPTATGSTAELRQFITEWFTENGISSFYYEAAKNAAFPYVVFDLREVDSFDDSGTSRRYTLECDAWEEKNRTALDNLLDYADAHLPGAYRGNNFTLSISSAYGRMDIDDPRLVRKRALFDVFYWNRKGLKNG